MEGSGARLGCLGLVEQARFGKPKQAAVPLQMPIRSPVAMTEQGKTPKPPDTPRYRSAHFSVR